MQPTKLPDDLFADDEWRAADYPGRVGILLARYVRSSDNNTLLLRQLAAALAEIETQKLTTHPTEGAGK